METDVLIVGSGPTGLMVAGDLARAGVRCTVLEQRDGGRDDEWTSRAFAVHALEQFDARGMADDLVATGSTVTALRLFGQTHIDLSRLPTKYPYLLVTPQFNTERGLADRARKLGVEFVHGVRVDAVGQDADAVFARAGHRDWRAKYLVGADGIHSMVRDAVGLPYPGRAAVTSIMLADVRLDQPPSSALTVDANAEGFAFIAPYGDGWSRVFAWDPRHPMPESAPVSLEEVRDVVKRVLGSDFGMRDARWTSRFHSDERQAPHYRVGRVFLAGDAAHCHSPAGGMGMNTGIQDAANLGWKLAAAVQGWGSEALLDSYEAERHPVGKMVLRLSGALVRLAVSPGRVERLFRTAIGGIALRVPAIQAKGAMNVSGIGIAYPYGGVRAPDLAGGDLYPALRDGRFVLQGASQAPDGYEQRVRALAGSGELRLVRPDGYVAWTGHASDQAGLRGALAFWCGGPA